METICIDYERKTLRNNRVTILHGDIDNCVAEDFVVDMYIMSIENKEPITVIISSNGGEVEPSIACIRAIMEAQKVGINVVGQVYGHAESAAFLILQCCDYRTMGKFCILMAHGITWASHGDLKDREAEGKLINFWKNEFTELISNRCNKDDKYSKSEFWDHILKHSTPHYFTSSEALEIGLVDEVE